MNDGGRLQMCERLLRQGLIVVHGGRYVLTEAGAASIQSYGLAGEAGEDFGPVIVGGRQRREPRAVIL